MKVCSLIFIVLALIFSCGCSGEKLELADQKDKESYSLGYRFGENMKFQETQLNFEVYMSGIRDALDGKESQLDSEEMQKILRALQQRLSTAQQKAQKDRAEKNLSEGEAFLAENEKKEGVKTLASGLQYKVLTDGTGKMPQKSDTVSVHYRGTFIDGTEFDSSYGRGQPTVFKVDGVIPGWTEALLLMKEGDKWQVFIPSELAYGARGIPQRIPPNSVLIFDVELVAIQ